MKNVTVIKLGGSLLEDRELRLGVLSAIATAKRKCERIVIVHGGGKAIDRNLHAQSIERKFHDGLRITDDATLAVVVETLTGEVRRTLTSELAWRHVPSIGVSGLDGRMIEATAISAKDGIEFGHVGEVSNVRPDLIEALLFTGKLPLIASIASSPELTPLNVNADSVASAIAVALEAKRLVFLTDVEGVRDETGEVLEQLTIRKIDALLESEAVSGGMRPKLRATREAVARGVSEVVIAGPARHQAVLEGQKGGTLIAAA